MSFYVVHFHADGGQACIPGRRVFTDPDEADHFAHTCRNERGHTCHNSVRVEITETDPGNDGRLYR